MLRTILSFIFLTAAGSVQSQSFDWYQSGTGIAGVVVAQPAGFTRLDAADPASGDFAFARNILQPQLGTIGQRVRIRVTLSNYAMQDHFVAALNYRPIYGWYNGNYGVVANEALALVVGNVCSGPGSIAFEAIGGSPQFASCQTLPASDVVIDFAAFNDGYVSAYVLDASGTVPLATLSANLGPHFPYGVPQDAGHGFAAIFPHLQPTGHHIAAEILDFEYYIPQNCLPLPLCN